MKITVFNGSPRKGKGNTHIVSEAFLKGIIDAGGHGETIFLADQDIKHCTACFACWDSSPGKCVLNDDMAVLIEKILKSDAIVFATPLHTDSASAFTKNFMERMMPLLKPELEVHCGETRHVSRYIKTPSFIVISNCAYPEYSQFQVLSLLFKRFAREIGTHVSLEIMRTQGSLLKTRHDSVKEFLNMVTEAGRQFDLKGQVEKSILQSFRKPLIPDSEYREKVNAYWRKQQSHL